MGPQAAFGNLRPARKTCAMLEAADISRLLTGVGMNPGPPVRRQDPPETMPQGPGSYLLLIRIARPCPLPRGRHAGQVLPPGLYAYAGSARGPGGLRARVRRHLRKEKRLHWHVDALTVAAEDVRALLFPGPDVKECDLVAALRRSGRFGPILPGLGSADCRRCPAHVLRLVEQDGMPFPAAATFLPRAPGRTGGQEQT